MVLFSLDLALVQMEDDGKNKNYASHVAYIDLVFRVPSNSRKKYASYICFVQFYVYEINVKIYYKCGMCRFAINMRLLLEYNIIRNCTHKRTMTKTLQINWEGAYINIRTKVK